MKTTAQEKIHSMRAFKSRVLEPLWQAEPADLTRVKRLLSSFIKIVFLVGRDFIENLVKLQAMALAFKTLLSIAPLLAVIFSILKGFGVHNRIEPVLAEALAPLGDKGQEVASHLVGFVDKMSAGALGSVGVVTLFITVLSLMGTIEQAFNTIWRVRFPRKLARRFSDYLSVLLVGPVLVFAALTITATLQSNSFVRNLLALEPFGTVMLILLRLVPYVTLWGAFTLSYLFIPNTRVRLRSALVGGLVAALLWQTIGWGFATFVASSTRYYAIYSSFAILLLFLLWLYVGWLIVLLGAQVSHAHQHIRFYYGQRENLARSPAGREKLALQLLLLIARNFHLGLNPMSITDLANRLQLPAALVKEFLEMFQQAQLVLPLADEETFVLARAPERIKIKEILDCIRTSGDPSKGTGIYLREPDGIDELLLALDQSVAATLDGKTLQSLIGGAGPDGDPPGPPSLPPVNPQTGPQPDPNPPPVSNPPALPPIPAPAAGDCYTTARNNFSRFARSGGNDRTSLGRAMSNYVSTASGGSRTAAQRMGASRAAGSRLFSFLSGAASTSPREALRALNLENLAGRPIEEVFLGLADYICPDGGTIDEGIARDAFIETIGELAENGITNIDGLTPDQIQTIFELYAAHAIEARLCNDIGTKSIVLPANASAAARVQAQLLDFVRRGVADALTAARTAMQALTPDRVFGFVTNIYEQAFFILQTLGDAEAEAT